MFIELSDKYATDADDVAREYVAIIKSGNYPVVKQALSLHESLKKYLIQLMKGGWTSSQEKECILYLNRI